jgi:hypothetical protein
MRMILIFLIILPAFGQYGLTVFNSGAPVFSFTRSVTVDRTTMGVSNLTNFPVLVSVSDTSMALVGSGGKIQHSTTQLSGSLVAMPADLAFGTDSLCASKVPWEVLYWNSTTGVLVAHVLFSTVNGSGAGSNSSRFMCFGGSMTSPLNTVAASLQPALVYDSNFVVVSHLGDGNTISLTDSSQAANTIGSVNAVPAGAGKIAGAGVFNGTSQYLNIGDNAGLRPTSVTVSMWVNPSSSPGNFRTLMSKPSQTASDNGYDLGTNSTGHWRGYVFEGAGPILVAASDSSTISTSTWYFLTMTYDASTGVTTLYVNNNAAITATGASAGNISYGTDTHQLGIGASLTTIGSVAPGSYFPGTLDEFRLSNIPRSSDWRLAEYANGNAPGGVAFAAGFIIYGSEVAN